MKKNKSEFFRAEAEFELNYVVLPRGLMRQARDLEFMDPRRDKVSVAQALDTDSPNLKVYLDFRDEEHLYQLI